MLSISEEVQYSIAKKLKLMSFKLKKSFNGLWLNWSVIFKLPKAKVLKDHVQTCQLKYTTLLLTSIGTLEALSLECGLIFVNTEEWVPTSSWHRESYQKPDGLSTPTHGLSTP